MRRCNYAFRILGPTSARRRLVDAAAAFEGYARGDPRARPECEAYLSAFEYGEEFRRHLAETGSTRAYTGDCAAQHLWFDIDVANDLPAAQRAAVALFEAVRDRYKLEEEDALIFFSGSKGFHVGVPTAPWSPEPSPLFHRFARHFATRLAEAASVPIDSSIYDKVRAFRAPNSRHARSGLHKVRLTVDEARRLTVRSVLRLARQPRPFRPPSPQRRSGQALEDWRQSVHEVETGFLAKAERSTSVSQGMTLNRLTLELIRDGSSVTVGDRHRRLFSAAANLAEFGCPPALAHALLMEAGLDSGLPPKEVRRQIDCGLAHRGGKEHG